jgi:hypothetical protein
MKKSSFKTEHTLNVLANIRAGAGEIIDLDSALPSTRIQMEHWFFHARLITWS